MVNTEIRLIIFFAAKDGESLYSQQKQDEELTVAQIMNSLLPNSDLNWRKKGKPLDHWDMTYLNQIPYNYTVEVKNRLKGLDLIDRVPDELWTEVLDTAEDGIKIIPKKRCVKSKMVVWGGLTNSCEKKRSKNQKRKGKIYPFEYKVPNSKER